RGTDRRSHGRQSGRQDRSEGRRPRGGGGGPAGEAGAVRDRSGAPAAAGHLAAAAGQTGRGDARLCRQVPRHAMRAGSVARATVALMAVLTPFLSAARAASPTLELAIELDPGTRRLAVRADLLP